MGLIIPEWTLCICHFEYISYILKQPQKKNNMQRKKVRSYCLEYVNRFELNEPMSSLNLIYFWHKTERKILDKMMTVKIIFNGIFLYRLF